MEGALANRPVWSDPGTRDADEIARVLAFRRARALRDYERSVRESPPATCPICGYEGPFAPKRHKAGIWCPSCDSRPRHRLMRLWLERHFAEAADAEVIHFAAEPWARAWFEARGARYRTADITDAFDLTLDITAMDLPDASVDLLIAHHVLEHVDDAKTLSEIHRVLRPNGRAMLTVPLIEGWDETLEVGHLPPAERARRAGDPDHLRLYGRDLRARFAAADLHLSEYPAIEPDVSTHALARGERLFLLAKPANTGA